MDCMVQKRSIRANIALLSAAFLQAILSTWVLSIYFPFTLLSLHGIIYFSGFFAIFSAYLAKYIDSASERPSQISKPLYAIVYILSVLLFTWMIFPVKNSLAQTVQLPFAIFSSALISNGVILFLFVLFNSRTDGKAANRFAGVCKFLLGGVVFFAIFHLAYLEIKPHLYENRDDGIITLSHARNLVEYGSIGVNPAGERVEGFSTPAQFLLFLPAYFLTRMDFSTWSALQTGVSTFILGGVFLLFFEYWLVGLPLTIAAAAFLAFNPSFIEWHASGMENSILHVLFLVALLFLNNQLKDGKIRPVAIFIVFFASIARIDSIYYILPLVCIFAWFWWMDHRNLKGLAFLGSVLLVWGIFMLARFLYFGQIFPNTADAQGISVFSNFQDLFNSLLHGSENNFGSVITTIFVMHGGWIYIVGLVLLPFSRRNRSTNLILAASTCLIGLSLLSPLVFSASRIDVTRTTTQMALFVLLFFVIVLSIRPPRILSIFILTGAIYLVLFLVKLNYQEPYYLGWDTEGFLPIHNNFIQIAQEQEIDRPTVANTDLGIISWHKDFNIIDLAFLGNPVVAKLRNEPDKLSQYIFHLVLPDIIEIHQPWSCAFSFYSPNGELQKQYEPADPNQIMGDTCPTGYFIRKDITRDSQSDERQFMDALQQDITLELIQQEIQKCQLPGEQNGCLYVTRSVYRVLPEIREMGLLPQVLECFEDSPSVEFDLAVLNSANDPNWPQKVIEYINTNPN